MDGRLSGVSSESIPEWAFSYTPYYGLGRKCPPEWAFVPYYITERSGGIWKLYADNQKVFFKMELIRENNLKTISLRGGLYTPR